MNNINSKKIHFQNFYFNLSIFAALTLIGTFLLKIFGNEAISNDANNYFDLFERLSNSGLQESLIRELTEPGYLYISWLASKVFSPSSIFFLAGFLPLLYKLYLLRKLEYGIIAIFLYFLLFLPIQEANQIRGALASCFILYSLLYVPKTSRSYIYLALFSSLFHYSGIIIVAFFFLDKFKSNIPAILAIIFFGIFWNWLISNIALFSFLGHQMSGEEIGVNFTSPIFILHLLTVIAICIMFKDLNYMQRKGFHLILIGLLVYVVFSDTPVIAHRIRELSLLGLIPVLFFQTKTSYSFLFICTTAFLVSFYSAYMNYSEVFSYYSVF